MVGEDGGAMIGANVQERAYTAPFFAFIALFALGSLVGSLFEGQAAWYVATPNFWLFPLQTLVSGGLLWHWRRQYESSPVQQPLFTIGAGLLALAVWVVPQIMLKMPPRLEGFNPEHFGLGGPYWLNLSLRLIRMVVVVPIIEELFWRGFLLRFLIDQDFLKVPVGTYSRLSFWVVTAGFCLEHQPADYAGAILTGMLYNYVAYRTKSIGSCILAHAVTNAALAAYVLYTRQWGFW
jgi:CAAX prenyl protease-like protein